MAQRLPDGKSTAARFVASRLASGPCGRLCSGLRGSMSDYTWHVACGSEVLEDAALVHALARAWASAYRASRVPAQRDDALYAPERQDERVKRLDKELRAPSARLAYLLSGAEIAGFFWGLSVADLASIDADKAGDVRPFSKSPPEQVAYLSMLGCQPAYAGQGLGRQLTTRLCAAFASGGACEAVARTINEAALHKVYQPLGFVEYRRFADSRSGHATRVIFGAHLPLPLATRRE